MNGYEVCGRIREKPWGKDVMLVALTGWGQDEDRHRSREAGFDAHMVKPVDHDVLMKLLASADAILSRNLQRQFAAISAHLLWREEI